MAKGHGGYDVRNFPRMRRLVVDATRAGRHRSMIHGVIDVDVTHAREVIADHASRTGEKLSFTAFVIACVGRAVASNRMVHAVRNLRGKLVLFDDVDVTTLVELPRPSGRGTFPVPHTVRAANRRSPWEIHREIRAKQEAGIEGLPLSIKAMVASFVTLPGFARRGIFRFLQRSPHLLRRAVGTVNVTAVGMFGRRGGHGVAAPSMFGLDIVIGGIETRPVFVEDGRVEAREFLDVTISFDHDVVDGGPAARFVRELRELMERAATLEGELGLAEMAEVDEELELEAATTAEVGEIEDDDPIASPASQRRGGVGTLGEDDETLELPLLDDPLLDDALVDAHTGAATTGWLGTARG